MIKDNSERALINKLGELMSDVSERCYAAGWLSGAEYFIPELCRRALEENCSQDWGMYFVSVAWAQELTDVANSLGSWVKWDNAEAGIEYIKFNPFPIPDYYKNNLDDWKKERNRI